MLSGAFLILASALNLAPGTVEPTTHPLVARYRVPACDRGIVTVAFRRSDTSVTNRTPGRPCVPGVDHEFLVGGMRSNTRYFLRHEIALNGQVQKSEVLAFTTGPLPSSIDESLFTTTPPDPRSSLNEPVLLVSTVPTPAFNMPVALDNIGKVIWYFEPPPQFANATYLTRAVEGGTFLMIASDGNLTAQRVWEIDLTGAVLHEITREQANAQLVLRGEDQISGFHHEAVRLPNGQTLVIAGVERILNDVQGDGPVNVLGDMVIALDSNWSIIWTWNSFEHLDPARMASLGEDCQYTCNTPLFLDSNAEDWTHSNAISHLPAEGNLLLSIRNQDWVVKLDYRNGTGGGSIIWRLGREGDFSVADNDLWFNHQHDASWLGGSAVMLFDNSTLRCSEDPSKCESRGQVVLLDTSSFEAAPLLNLELGRYAQALGSAQRLENGNFLFTSGAQALRLFGTTLRYSTADEFMPDGTRTYTFKTPLGVYRAYRMKDLYTASR